MSRRRRPSLLLVALVALVATVAAPLASPGGSPGAAEAASPAAAAGRPNIVLVLMDDFSMDLLQTMPAARAMRRDGASYRHAYVVDSLCCVSRASIFTGQFPHQTGVLTNSANMPNPHGPAGGWQAFREYGNIGRSFNVHLKNSGYTTGFIGKYLNQYEAETARPVAGWTEFRPMFGTAYDGWKYKTATSLNGGPLSFRYHPKPRDGAGDATWDKSYAGHVLGRQALDFIRRREDDRRPYFLEVSTYAPHQRLVDSDIGGPRFPPAMRDRPGHGMRYGNCGAVDCRSLDTSDLAGWRDDSSDNVPRWGDGTRARPWRRDELLPASMTVTNLRDRARMVQSVDRMLRAIRRTVGPDTYVLLTSDNGFHLGQSGMMVGKGSAYATDTRVPLLVTGPGVVPGERQEMVQNVDLAPTIEALAGLGSPRFRFGKSFAHTFSDPARVWRRYMFMEHTNSAFRTNDPDAGDGELSSIPTYVAVRSATGLLVRYDLRVGGRVRRAWEYYDYTELPWERTNSYHHARQAAEVRVLKRRLTEFLGCRGYTRGERVPVDCRALTG